MNSPTIKREQADGWPSGGWPTDGLFADGLFADGLFADGLWGWFVGMVCGDGWILLANNDAPAGFGQPSASERQRGTSPTPTASGVCSANAIFVT